MELYILAVVQVHNLLDLVKQEQLIYSICFHEVIRQVHTMIQ